MYHFLFMVHFPDDNNNSSKHLKLRSAWDVPSLISKATITARFETAAAWCDYFLQAWEETKRMTWCWSNVGFFFKKLFYLMMTTEQNSFSASGSSKTKFICSRPLASADKDPSRLYRSVCVCPGQNLVTAEAMFSKADRASEEGKAWMASRALLPW